MLRAADVGVAVAPGAFLNRSIFISMDPPLADGDALLNGGSFRLFGGEHGSAGVAAVGNGATSRTLACGGGGGGHDNSAAVGAADVVINSIAQLAPLLLLHGRWGWLRLRGLVGYWAHLAALLVLVQVGFGMISSASAQPLLYGWPPSLLQQLWGSAPAIVLALYEQDLPRALLLAQPRLYAATSGGLARAVRATPGGAAGLRARRHARRHLDAADAARTRARGGLPAVLARVLAAGQVFFVFLLLLAYC
ncbi:hypothetical protein T492DRAFT_336184 [Pavlovales sp. CCMP2436]|nr:hypothetical protein T492DRAFT_336184 [Pavlovales sp. CCMP2436]